jgi:hypothetical protein
VAGTGNNCDGGRFHNDPAAAGTYVDATLASDDFVVSSITFSYIAHTQAGYCTYDVLGCTAGNVCTVLEAGTPHGTGDIVTVNPAGVAYKKIRVRKNGSGAGPWMGGIKIGGTGTPPSTDGAVVELPASAWSVDTSQASAWSCPSNVFSATAGTANGAVFPCLPVGPHCPCSGLRWHSDSAAQNSYVTGTLGSSNSNFIITTATYEYVAHSQAGHTKYTIIGCTASGDCDTLEDSGQNQFNNNPGTPFAINPLRKVYQTIKVQKPDGGNGPWMGGLTFGGY